MLSMVITAILLLLSVLILAGPLLEEFLDWLMPAPRRHSPTLR
jgi:hypothetical protein